MPLLPSAPANERLQIPLSREMAEFVPSIVKLGALSHTDSLFQSIWSFDLDI